MTIKWQMINLGHTGSPGQCLPTKVRDICGSMWKLFAWCFHFSRNWKLKKTRVDHVQRLCLHESTWLTWVFTLCSLNILLLSYQAKATRPVLTYFLAIQIDLTQGRSESLLGPEQPTLPSSKEPSTGRGPRRSSNLVSRQTTLFIALNWCSSPSCLLLMLVATLFAVLSLFNC